MGQIQVMSEALANQIAAGEVVERPASCVKELVENSLDAGAKTIVVQLEEGGIKRIRVQDDGHGMDESDLQLAFARHATSKVKTSRDLFRIGTLGFRGEALASIAAVARVTMQSRERHHEEGHLIRVEGSTITGPVEPVGLPVGTVIDVADLFYNTPARLKYLRTVQTEQARSVEVVQKAALSRPDVRMRVEVDGHVLFQTTGTGNPQNVLATLYGVGEAGQFLRVEGETADYRVMGYVGRPTQARSNRQHANLFINHRPIRNIAVHQAVAGGYGQRLMVNKQPIYALYIELDPGLVDVNIHPHKSEVRFSEERDLTNLVGRLVREALDKAFLVPKATFSSEGTAREERGARSVQTTLPGVAPKSPWRDGGRSPGAQSPGGQGGTDAANASRFKYPTGSRPVSPEVLSTIYGTGEDGASANGGTPSDTSTSMDARSGTDAGTRVDTRTGVEHDASAQTEDASMVREQGVASAASCTAAGLEHGMAENAATLDVLAAANIAGVNDIADPDASEGPKRDGWRLRPIGQTLGMYILADDGEDLYIIDQHAAHERVLYERFTKQMEAAPSHSIELLAPMTFHLSPGDAAVLMQHLEVLAEMGLAFEPFGGYSYLLRTIPAVWDGLDPAAMAQDLVSSIAEDARAVDVKLALRERIILRACKAAIKANHRLSTLEMNALVDAFSDLDDPFHCPHGRPVFVRLTSRDLEKGFKRIV